MRNVSNAFSTRRAALGGVQVDVVVFQRAPQSLDEDVVNGPAGSVHRDPHLGVAQDLDEDVGRELRTLSVLNISGVP